MIKGLYSQAKGRRYCLGSPRSKVVFVVAVLILISVFIVILLSVNTDHKVDLPSVDQVDLVVATDKIEVAKPIPIEQPITSELTYSPALIYSHS